MKRALGILLATLIAFFPACGKSDTRSGSATRGPGRVIVYTSVDRIFSGPVLNRASKVLGFEVIGVYDTEETKSTGLVNRLIAKKKNPDGDLFWSGDPARAALLKKEGVTVPYDPPAASEIPAAYKDPERHWVGFSARSRILLVNNTLAPPGEEPKSLAELVEPKWKGRVAMANPVFGTTSFHMAALFESWGDEKAKRWLDQMRANGVQIVSSNGEVKRQVANGNAAVGLTDSDDALEAIKDGQPVRAEFLDQEPAADGARPLGNLVIPNTISLIQGARNAQGARAVFDFLLSPEASGMLAESCAQAPLSRGLTVPKGVLSLDSMIPMKVDYAACAKRLEQIMPWLKEWAERGR